MTIEKTLGVPLAVGRTAEVFPWGSNQVVKVFRMGTPATTVAAERQNTMVANQVGLPVPQVGDTVKICGRIGLIFERIEGPSMMEVVHSDPKSIEPMARLLAQLHVSLHRLMPPEEESSLPHQSQRLSHHIDRGQLLTKSQRRKLLETLATVADDAKICHGDFHPGNVLLADRGPVIIDWIDACRGNPLADVARTSLLFLGHIAHTSPSDPTRTLMEQYHQTYVESYRERLGCGLQEWKVYHQWIPIMAAARLTEGIIEQQDWLMHQVWPPRHS